MAHCRGCVDVRNEVVQCGQAVAIRLGKVGGWNKQRNQLGRIGCNGQHQWILIAIYSGRGWVGALLEAFMNKGNIFIQDGVVQKLSELVGAGRELGMWWRIGC